MTRNRDWDPIATMIKLNVNGETHTLPLPPTTPLLSVLRNDLSLNGPKYGCGLGECGACTIHVDGIAARACILTVGAIAGRRIVTLEGLGTAKKPHPVQAAFIAAAGAQCGYCLNGMIMTVSAFLDANPDPADDEIKETLRYNLCRCGAHMEILAAVKLAVRWRRG
jgi:nicotinate dehydrogenase subunit A